MYPGPNLCAANVDMQQTIIVRARNTTKDKQPGALNAAGALFYKCASFQSDVKSQIQELDLSEMMYEEAANYSRCNKPGIANLLMARHVVRVIAALVGDPSAGISLSIVRARLRHKVDACLNAQHQKRSS